MIDFDHLYKVVYKQSVNKIHRILRMNKSDAEDVVQQAMLKAIKYQGTYDSKLGTPRVWFNKILYQQLKDFKAGFVDMIHLDDELLVGNLKPEIILHIDNELKSVHNYNHRCILELFYRNGYSVNEIAKIMDCSRSNVTTVCNRFKQRLLEKYGEYL